MSWDTQLDDAQRALRLVAASPSEARQLATVTYQAAVDHGQLEAASVSQRARGLAEVYLGDIDTAVAHLSQAVLIANRAHLPQVAAEARMSLAFALIRQGRLRRAVSEITSALDTLDATRRGQGLAQRGAIFQQLGRLGEATADYRRALPLLRRADDVVWIQRVFCNRGVLHAFRHEYHLALRDLTDAERLCSESGLTLSSAIVQENLALVQRRLGNVPKALAYLDDAEQTYLAAGAARGSLLLERSEILFSVHLYSEAQQACQDAVAEFERTQQHLSLPEARLLLARVASLNDDPDHAMAEARRAVLEFRRQHRAEWVVVAQCALLLARLDASDEKTPTPGEMERAGHAAAEAAWPATALEMRLRAGLVAVATRRSRSDGLRLLESVSDARRRGTADRRVKGWYATAVLRRETGDRRGSKAAARRGLRIIDEYRRTIAATDLRARVSGLGLELSRLGLGMALESGDPSQVFEWAELSRSRHLRERPALPTDDDPRTTQLLAELRSTVAEIRERHGVPSAQARLLSRQVSLERAIRDATRGRSSHSVAAETRSLRPTDVIAALNGTALVEYVELDEFLSAVCLCDGQVTWHPLGPIAAVGNLLRWLPLEIQRLPRYAPKSPQGRRAIQVLASTTEQLSELLIRPLNRRLGDRPVVVVPTGILQSMPWSLLSTLRERPVTVAPSAGLWLAATQRDRPLGHVLAVAGPGLRAADQEARQVAALYPDGLALVAEDCTVNAVRESVLGVSLLHIAAHGTVRADNPLFSSLLLADGPLTVYDLEQFDLNADTVVMASCESARDVVLAGDEMLGLSAAFLARGVRNVVASVIPVPDASTSKVMVDLHRELARGAPVAEALSAAQRRVDRANPAALAGAAGFVCLGAGTHGDLRARASSD